MHLHVGYLLNFQQRSWENWRVGNYRHTENKLSDLQLGEHEANPIKIQTRILFLTFEEISCHDARSNLDIKKSLRMPGNISAVHLRLLKIFPDLDNFSLPSWLSSRVYFRRTICLRWYFTFFVANCDYFKVNRN